MPQPTTNNLEGWEDEFDKKFQLIPDGIRHIKYLFRINEDSSYSIAIPENIKQFISDLRKHDMEELIKRLPEKTEFANGEFQAMACGRLLTSITKLIKDYYETNNK